MHPRISMAFRLPSARLTAAHIWERVADYLQKICTVILWASIIIWALEYFPSQDISDLENSYLAMLGKVIEPVMRPLGFDCRGSGKCSGPHSGRRGAQGHPEQNQPPVRHHRDPGGGAREDDLCGRRRRSGRICREKAPVLDRSVDRKAHV